MSFSGLQAHPKEFESPYTKILLACLFSEENTGGKYDGCGHIIIERGQFSKIYLHGAVHDQAYL